MGDFCEIHWVSLFRHNTLEKESFFSKRKIQASIVRGFTNCLVGLTKSEYVERSKARNKGLEKGKAKKKFIQTLSAVHSAFYSTVLCFYICVCACCNVYLSCLTALLWFDNASHSIYFNQAQTESRPPWGHVLLCVYRNMLTISAAFIQKVQSKLPSQGCWVGNTCNTCTINWMVFQYWPLLSGRWTHTDFKKTILI